jgi:NADH:ubiquinone reductase (H+-translocating)
VAETVIQDNRSETSEQVEQFVSVADTMRPTVKPVGRPHVVIVGGGFAGLSAARSLKDADVKVTLIDRRNHHLFAPLLYQVATAQLSPANIAQPIRAMLSRQKNATVLMGEVEHIDADARTLTVDNGRVIPYDYLIVAVGATHSYFGHDEWAPLAPGLKTIDDATKIRRRILEAFEEAESATDAAEREALLTFVVIGGGPTGVELAGAIGEIARHTLVKDFQHIDSRDAKILLLEGLPRILPMFPEKLSSYAVKDLAKFGVEVRTNSLVTGIDEHGVNIGDERIDAKTVLWAAGVQVSPLTRVLGGLAELDRAGRVPVTAELNIAGHPEIFVIGDAASIKNSEGKPVPGVAPAAMQQGKWAASNIARALRGEAYVPFVYNDRGNLATIGRNQAVASVKGRNFNGFPAWLMWMVVHIFYLNDLKNRALVISQWLYSYISHGRSARLITGENGNGKKPAAAD